MSELQMKRPISIARNRPLKEPAVLPTRLTRVIAVIIRQEEVMVVVAKAVEAQLRQAMEAASAAAQKD